MVDLWTILAAMIVGAIGGGWLGIKVAVPMVFNRACAAALAAGADPASFAEQVAFQNGSLHRYRADRERAIQAAAEKLKATIQEEAHKRVEDGTVRGEREESISNG